MILGTIIQRPQVGASDCLPMLRQAKSDGAYHFPA